jgi:hypothetical protein
MCKMPLVFPIFVALRCFRGIYLIIITKRSPVGLIRAESIPLKNATLIYTEIKLDTAKLYGWKNPQSMNMMKNQNLLNVR